ncbi:MAG TPA: dienelactone hydrolase family protein [Bauldia sp.]|nr:dienelactone hydrolase family protein [Bauldia sp.]
MTGRPEITQDMIRAYDDYTHLTLDRRGFMETLTRLAGSAAAAAAIAPMIASNYAHAQTVPPDDSRLKIEDVSYPGASGPVKAYLAMPAEASGKLPSVIVIHENRGLNPHIKDVTRRLALDGFIALGIDLLSAKGGTPPTDEEAAKLFQDIDRAALVPDAVAAIAYLKGLPEANGKVGAVGFCFGGGIVNQMAVASPDLVAGVAYYGSQPRAEDVPKIKAALLLHYAGLDERINAGIPAFEEALKANGVTYQLFVYDGVNHAFNNDTSAARYNKEAADLAWSRTVAFLKEELG